MKNNTAFIELVRLRSRVRFILAACLVSTHAFFVGGIAFYSDFFATPLSEGSGLTVGIVSTVGVILTMITLEWVYILISDKWLDPMQLKVVRGKQDEK